MALSPSTLFHFTNKEGLKGILSNNFKLKYCLEKLPNGNDEGRIAIPMVSFCDIKISEISDHISKYGQYGIGLSKNWAIEKGLSPVFYQSLNSSFSTSLKSKISNILLGNRDEDAIDIIFDFLRLSKEYEGKLVRNRKIIEKNYRYADEREWRYVPKLNRNRNFPDFLLEEDYNTPTKKQIANRKLSNERLFFNANEIMYLIVKNDDDISDLISHIRNVKGKNYSYDEIDRLTTRIITCERILNDF